VALAAAERGDGALADEELWPDDELWPDEEPGPDDELAVACVEPGRVKASPPATASPRAPAPAVTARSRLRARSRRTRADTVRGSLLFIIAPSTKLTPLDFRNSLWLRFPLRLQRL
jgi:hypothetical protein